MHVYIYMYIGVFEYVCLWTWQEWNSEKDMISNIQIFLWDQFLPFAFFYLLYFFFVFQKKKHSCLCILSFTEFFFPYTQEEF